MKATAIAPANIALIKYWGRRDGKLRIPYNASISMNLSACTTTTTVEFLPDLPADDVTLLDSGGFNESEVSRVSRQLDVIRAKANVKLAARVVTQNSFPKSTGAASSASGFAALTVAAAAALGLDLSEKELTALARVGSGSACRSIPDGFVKWEMGSTPAESFAHSLYPHDYWDLRDILVVVATGTKDISSSAGHDSVETSPLFQKRLEAIPDRIQRLEEALRMRNFQQFGEIIEEDCLDTHKVMQTQVPPLMYWSDMTKKLMDSVLGWRKAGLAVYFTIDAGPNVHLICEGKDEARVLEVLKKLQGVHNIIVNTVARGARLI